MVSTDKNLSLVRHAFAELERGNVDALRDEITGPDYRIHETFCDELTKSALSDCRITLEDMIATGDKVVTRYTVRGEHVGEGTLPGVGLIKPSGRHVEIEGIVIHRIAHGQIVEGWGCVDSLQTMLDLGIVELT